MGIRLKLLLPMVMLWLGLFALVNFSWIPNLEEKEIDFYLHEQEEKIDLLITGLTESILQSDLGNIHATIDAVLEKNSDWISITLRDTNGELLFPFDDLSKDDHPETYLHIDYRSYDNRNIVADVNLVTNPSKAIDKSGDLVNQIRWMIIFLLVVAISFTIFIQENVIRKPLKRLSDAMLRINQQDYSVRLPEPTNDEIGSLINTFKEMRHNLQMHDAQLYRMRDKALASSKAKSEFIAKMNHELRTPLNGILGSVQLMEQDLDEGIEINREYLSLITKASTELLETVNNVLTLAKNSKGKLELNNKHFNLRSLIEHSIDLFTPAIRKGNNTLEFHYSLNNDEIYGDEEKIQIIINNLVSNACKFTKNGEVLVNVFSNESDGESRIVMEVSDSGIGIKEEDQDKIFEAFIQVDNSYTREYDGTGLGLSMCSELANLMQGEIGVSSSHGKGSTFRFVFPASVKLVSHEIGAASRT